MIIPKELTIIDLIDQVYEENQGGFREHLGASQIGEDCLRKLWYSFRWYKKPKFKGRLLRLFETGQLYEDRFNKMLRAIGWEVIDIDPETGEQFRCEEFKGHFGGSCDGIVRPPNRNQLVLEYKTHNEKSFKDLLKKGVELSKPVHYAQVQVYMHKFNIAKTLYLAVNKNTDELYSEKIQLKKRVAQRLIKKAKIIIESNEPPPRAYKDPTFYKCNWCEYRNLCHFDNEQPEINCRTCRHSTPNLIEGGWDCCYTTPIIDLPKEYQLKACEKYQKI